MEQEALLKNGTDLVYLAHCALAGKMPQSTRVEAMDLGAVHALAKKQSMAAISAYAIESYCKANPDSQVAQHPVIRLWRQDKAMAVRKNLMMDMEREKILGHLEQIGCWYMPMKGVILQQLYPRVGMRQMSDNDILIDPAYRKEVRDYMEKNGYETDSVMQSIHDEYMKKPAYHFEMHIAMLDSIHHPERVAYYRNIKERLQKDADNSCGYHFSDEDFYIYMHVHAAKHFETCGNGIRSLMDVWQYLSQKGAGLDRQYVSRVLEKMELTEYAQAMETLSTKLFCTEEPLSPQEQELFLYHVSAGTYGTIAQRVDNGLLKFTFGRGKVTFWSKLCYSLRRLYPSAEFYEHRMPLVYKYKVLMPFAAVYRLLVGLCTRFPEILAEIKGIWKRKK